MDDELIDLLRTVASGFRMRLQEQVAASVSGLPEFQGRLINLIARNEGISQLSLASLTGRDKAQVARAIKELEAHGFVTKSAHASDWRTQCLALTAKGRETHARLHDMRKKLGAAALSSLTHEEKHALKACLSKVKLVLED
ncbi:MAG: MarR family winged helix-turn-helix transcriptional regulator [Sphingobium sp.]